MAIDAEWDRRFEAGALALAQEEAMKEQGGMSENERKVRERWPQAYVWFELREKLWHVGTGAFNERRSYRERGSSFASAERAWEEAARRIASEQSAEQCSAEDRAFGIRRCRFVSGHEGRHSFQAEQPAEPQGKPDGDQKLVELVGKHFGQGNRVTILVREVGPYSISEPTPSLKTFLGEVNADLQREVERLTHTAEDNAQAGIKFMLRAEKAEANVERLREALEHVIKWADAYPVDVFPEPDWKQAQNLLGDALLSGVSAANMRHVLTGAKRIASEALAATQKEA